MIDKIRFKLGDTAYYRKDNSVHKFIVETIRVGKRFKSDKDSVFYGKTGTRIDDETWYEDQFCFLDPIAAFESDV